MLREDSYSVVTTFHSLFIGELLKWKTQAQHTLFNLRFLIYEGKSHMMMHMCVTMAA